MAAAMTFFFVRCSSVFRMGNVPKLFKLGKLICERALAVTYLISVCCGWRAHAARQQPTHSIVTNIKFPTYIFCAAISATVCCAFSVFVQYQFVHKPLGLKIFSVSLFVAIVRVGLWVCVWYSHATNMCTKKKKIYPPNQQKSRSN